VQDQIEWGARQTKKWKNLGVSSPSVALGLDPSQIFFFSVHVLLFSVHVLF